MNHLRGGKEVKMRTSVHLELKQPCTVPSCSSILSKHQKVGRCKPIVSLRATEHGAAIRTTHSDPQSSSLANGPAIEPPGSSSSTGCPVMSALPVPDAPVSPLDFINSILDPINMPNKFLASSNSPIVNGRFFGFPLLMLGDHAAAKEFLAYESEGKVSNGWPPSADALMGSQSISVVKDPQQHLRLRRLIYASISGPALLPLIQTATQQLLDKWVTMSSEQGSTVPVVPMLTRHSFVLITHCALGIEMEGPEMETYIHDFELWDKALFTPFAIDQWPFPFHDAMKARERLKTKMQALVTQFRTELQQDGTGQGAAANMHSRTAVWRMLQERDEQGQGLTDEQIIDNLLTLMFSGRDTTSSVMSSLMHDLALRPDVLVRLREEQQRVMATYGTNITQAALDDMPYTYAVIMECMRCRPLLTGVMRSTSEDVAVAGYRVDKGKTVMVQYNHMVNNDPRWPAEGNPATNPLHPANFNPDRFMTEEGQKQGWQVPFGMGRRVCVGQYMAMVMIKAFLALIARDYTYTADACGQFKKIAFLPFPANDLPIIMTRTSQH